MGKTEHELLELARELGGRNQVFRSFIGMGYSDCTTPPVILRNSSCKTPVGTRSTPRTRRRSQGRLEALLNFQTMVSDLTVLAVANASLLDEGTAAAEAMHLAYAFKGSDTAKVFFVSDSGLPPADHRLVQTRAATVGIEVVVGFAQNRGLRHVEIEELRRSRAVSDDRRRGPHRRDLRGRSHRPRERHRVQAAAPTEQAAPEGVTMRTPPCATPGMIISSRPV